MKYVTLAGICAAAVFTAWPGGASASGLMSQTMAPHDWSGPYIGVQTGYAIGNADHSFSNGAPSDSSDPDGFLIGGHIGYLIQNNQIVFGIEGDLEYTDIDGSFQNSSGITSSGSTEIDLQGSIRGKLGYAMDRFMPYVTGGVAIADVEYGGGPVGGPCCGYSKTAIGWTVGVGMQYALSGSMSARVEYRYTDYGTEKGDLSPAFPSVDMKTDLTIHAVMFGVSLHF